MKYKTTKKQVNATYDNKLCVGYCNLQYLLGCEEPESYLTRREGWAADVYSFGRDAIVTGYSPFGNIRPTYYLCKKYDDRARKIRCDYSLDYKAQKNMLRTLIDQFIAEAKAETA